jgi:two-component system, LytTR family, sensor kinase
MNLLAGTKELLFTLLMRVAAAASLAALAARFAVFRRALFSEPRSTRQKAQLLLMLGLPLALGVWLRQFGYRFTDLTLEGSFLFGLMGGRVLGPVGGFVITLPALGHHEWLAAPVAAAVGLLGGLIRGVMPNRDEVWRFGPFTFLSIPRRLWGLVRHGEPAWEMLPLAACVVIELGGLALSYAMPHRLFVLVAQSWWQLLIVVFATIFAVSMPIKIWNSIRLEMNLEKNQQMLLRARMDALSSQINPHFLFNTLNTVSSLVRFDPDRARLVILKLSKILRRLLRKHETFVPLREELEFIDDYLDIEVARFGPDKLQIFKEVDEQALDSFVPSMLLQPIVENAIKHGLTPKLEGGEIHLRTRRQDGRLRIEVEDNGTGISAERLRAVYDGGIGISNVRERLRLLYGNDFLMEVESREGEGTRIRIEVPDLVPAAPAAT